MWSWCDRVSMTVLFHTSYQDQCLCWCPELSLFLNIACLLCPHLLLTLCIWITSWAAISSFESPVSPSSARVGVASMALQSFKSFAGLFQFASQVPASVKFSVAFVQSLLWMPVLEGVKLFCVMLHFGVHQAFEYFFQAVQVIKGLASLSRATYLLDSVLMMRERCTGLTLWMPTLSLICLEKSLLGLSLQATTFSRGSINIGYIWG